MAVAQGRDLALVVARLAITLILLPQAFDWRSPMLASVRIAALAALLLLPAAIIAAEIVALRRVAARGVRVLNVVSLALAGSCLVSVVSLEARFQWQRDAVLRADPAQLERLGRHIVVGYRDVAELKALIDRRAVAGVFLTTRNVEGRDAGAVRREIAAMQEIRRQQGLPPLLIATDQEGGSVSRLSPPLTRMPPLSAIVARYSDPAERRQAVADYAAAQARELADLGVNVNLAPVVDLDHGMANPDDRLTRISTRAIGKDPQLVTEVAGSYCSNLSAGGVRCTLKHFPGLGRVFEDTHLNTADLAAPPSELAAFDWLPFRTLMGRDDVMVMLGHARLTALDRDQPVSFSRSVAHDLLRTDWGFDGVLMTDDFCMGAVFYSAAGIAGGSVSALNNGVDLILISYDADQFYVAMHALIEAARTGTLQDESLRQSDRRLGRALKR
jgi:beta-N-acetylhexosaminidase